VKISCDSLNITSYVTVHSLVQCVTVRRWLATLATGTPDQSDGGSRDGLITSGVHRSRSHLSRRGHRHPWSVVGRRQLLRSVVYVVFVKLFLHTQHSSNTVQYGYLKTL